MSEASLEAVVDRMAATLEASLSEMNRKLAESSAELDRKMAESSAELDRKMAESSAEFDRKLAESSAEFDRKLAEGSEEFDRKLAESSVETRRLMAESSAEFDRKLAERSEKFDRKMAESSEETRRLMAASSEETDRKIAASIAAIERSVENMTKEFGGFGNRLGQLTELVIVPGIRLQMNAFGHNFKYIAANKKVKAGGKIVAEMDVFLHNGSEAMAVEVKTMLTVEDVNEHEARLKTLRRCEELINIKNKALYGTVVGLVIDKRARKAALEKGFYVAEIMEDTERLEVECPKRRGRW